MKSNHKLLILTITIITVFLFVLVFISPLLILKYAEEQYFIDQYKKNKTAFEDVKTELLLALEQEDAKELNLVICYDGENGRLLQHYDHTTYSVDYSHPIDANGDSYDIVDKCFGDFGLSKIYVTQNYICLAEEGNNYQYIYSSERAPKSAHYAPHNDDIIRKLGNNWYLVRPN